MMGCELVCNPLGLHLSVEIDIPKKPHSVGMHLSVKLSYRRVASRRLAVNHPRGNFTNIEDFPVKCEFCATVIAHCTLAR